MAIIGGIPYFQTNPNGWWVQLHQGILDLRSAIAEAEDAGVDEDETMEARRVFLWCRTAVNFAFSQEHVHIDHIATFKEIYTVHIYIYTYKYVKNNPTYNIIQEQVQPQVMY